MGSSSLANEGVCVCERERDSGLRNSTALGGKVCVCERERERFWVKEWHGPRREAVCV